MDQVFCGQHVYQSPINTGAIISQFTKALKRVPIPNYLSLIFPKNQSCGSLEAVPATFHFQDTCLHVECEISDN